MKKIYFTSLAIVILFTLAFVVAPHVAAPGCKLLKETVQIPTQEPFRQAVRDRYVYDCGVTIVKAQQDGSQWKRTETRIGIRFFIAIIQRSDFQLPTNNT